MDKIKLLALALYVIIIQIVKYFYLLLLFPVFIICAIFLGNTEFTKQINNYIQKA